MTIARPWKSLAIEGDYPLLFLKAHLDAGRCALELTDLNRLWSGCLSRDELLKSASDQGTSIDPSEDDDQYHQFLSKFNSALNGEPRTTVHLEPLGAQDGLELSISAPLPGSLPTFEWTMQLRRVDNDNSCVFKNTILTPLLVHANNLMSQVRYLIAELGHKDRVIGKIADKLENIGQDLGQVFPGASNPRSTKATKRAQLASHVEGLAEFDPRKWQAAGTKDTEEDLSVDTMNTILANLPEAGLINAHKDTHGIWWRPRSAPVLHDYDSTEDDTGSGTAGCQSPLLHKNKDGTHPATQGSEENDGIRQQLTAPSFPTDEETEDEDDLDAPCQRAAQPEVFPQHDSNTSRTLSYGRASSQSQQVTDNRAQDVQLSSGQQLRIPGGKISEHPQQRSDEVAHESREARVVPPSSNHQADPDAGDFAGRLRSQTPGLDSNSVKAELFNSSPAKPDQPRRKLGAFGRKTRSSPTPDREPVADSTPGHGQGLDNLERDATMPFSQPADADHASHGRTKPRVGIFGSRRQNESQNAQADADAAIESSQKSPLETEEASPTHHMTETEDRQFRTQVKSEKVEQQGREESEERANIRREKLKRDIAEKSREPVKKKKRKF